MMENYENDETFLGRWIAGELSEEELSDFKKTKAYKQFKLINEESKLVSGPEIEVEESLQRVIRKGKPKPTGIKTVRLWQTIGIAAMLVISIGFYLNSSKTYSNGIGSTQTVVLEDGSTVNLNANSSISLKRFFWSTNKSVKLKGEAYFSIKKGEGFKVETSKGLVKVLGTEFNIKDRTIFELQCYEGKVEFSQKNKTSSSEILTKGMQINIHNNQIKKVTFQEESPFWITGISKFNEQPLHLVLEEISHYFDISINTEKINVNRLFSGSFQHKDLELALKATLEPMGITYKLEQDTYMLSE